MPPLTRARIDAIKAKALERMKLPVDRRGPAQSKGRYTTRYTDPTTGRKYKRVATSGKGWRKKRKVSFAVRARANLRVVGMGLKAIATDPAGVSQAMAVPVAGVGAPAKAAGAVIRAVPGMGRYLGREFPPGALSRVMRVGGAAALGAAAGEAVDYLQRRQVGAGARDLRYNPPARTTTALQPYQSPVTSGGTGMDLMHRQPMGSLTPGQEYPGGPWVIKTWDTAPGAGVTGGGGYPIFALLSDGRIIVSKPDGSYKIYRPKKNLVISSNPRLRDIRKLDRMHKKVVKMIKSIVPRPTRRK